MADITVRMSLWQIRARLAASYFDTHFYTAVVTSSSTDPLNGCGQYCTDENGNGPVGYIRTSDNNY